MVKVVIKDPVTQKQLPVIMENGKPRAVVIDIEMFNMLINLLGTLNKESIKEAILLGQSRVGKSAIDRGISAIKQGKIRPWRQALEEI